MGAKTFVITGILAVGGVAAAYWSWKVLPIRRVEEGIRAKLKDPDSARFFDVTYNRVTRAGCGVVNAKNSMGGYVGRTPFILTQDGKAHYLVQGVEGGSIDDKIVRERVVLEFVKLSQANCLAAAIPMVEQ